MRFVLEVEADESAACWRVIIVGPNMHRTRWMGSVESDEDGWHYPRPLPGTDCGASNLESEAMAAKLLAANSLSNLGRIADVQAAYEKIVSLSASPQDVDDFGRYLFLSLIGTAAWDHMVATNHGRRDGIELALCWPASDADLDRLNWELMHFAPGEPLAKHLVAITRLVKTAPRTLGPLDSLTRLLFVVGTELTDSSIHAGMEYFGLLRALKAQTGSHRLHQRILVEATPARLAEAMASFRPHIVHFICHGNEEGQIELRPDTGEADADRWRDAAYLLGKLAMPALPPPAPDSSGDTFAYPNIVVLSACFTGTGTENRVMGTHQTAPLAAELVRGGVPIVIGMAGSVADSACRLFTRSFGQALLTGEPLVQAAAVGRRAAFVDDNHRAGSVDWSFPALFLADHVPEGYKLPSDSNAETQLLNWLAGYKVDRNPVFCGREKVVAAYEEMLQTRKRMVLAISGAEGMGKTRLLEELVAQAVLDGHVPLPVLREKQGDQKPVRSRKELCAALLDSVIRVSEIYDVDLYASNSVTPLYLERLADPTKLLADATSTNASDLKKLAAAIRRANPQLAAALALSSAALKIALQRDLWAVVEAIRDRWPYVADRQGVPLVLLDNVQEYEPELLLDLFEKNSNGLLNEYGFGSSQERRIPVAMAFGRNDSVDRIVYTRRGFAGSLSGSSDEFENERPWMRLKMLEPFGEEKDEDLQIYEHVLLHPYNQRLMEDVSGKEWFFNNHADREQAEVWIDMFRDTVGGIPANMIRREFYATAKGAIKQKFLLPANDDELLKKSQEKPW